MFLSLYPSPANYLKFIETNSWDLFALFTLLLISWCFDYFIKYLIHHLITLTVELPPNMPGGGAGALKATRALLDELLGKDRNKPLSERNRKTTHFSDEDYCKYYLCGFCPYMLFTNTKSDLGVCNLKHSDAMREQFNKIPDCERASYRYEDDMQDFLEGLVREIERKISQRKRDSEAQLGALPPPDPALVSQKEAIEQEIEEGTEEMDRLNEETRFEDAKVCRLVHLEYLFY